MKVTTKINRPTAGQTGKSIAITTANEKSKLSDAIVKSCLEADLPEYAASNIIIVTKDTGKLYLGRGTGVPLYNIEGMDANQVELLQQQIASFGV